MEAIGSGALLRRAPVGTRQPAGDLGLLLPRARSARVKIGDGFKDEGHLRYYASAAAPDRCGQKKEEKRRMKLVKGLEKDLSALFSMGNSGVDEGEGMAGEIKGQTISEAAELLLAQLTKLRGEAKEMKKRRKQEKAAKKASKMKNQMDSEGSSSSSSSESSGSECETVVKMSSLRTESGPVTEAALQTEDVVEEARKSLSLNSEPRCCFMSSAEAVAAVRPAENKIEVCMGGKCKKSGAMELMAEFEKEVGIEGAVVGCRCMGKCRDGPNVRVVNRSSVEDRLARAAKGPLCVGVGLEDVGSIVADFFEGSNGGVAGLLAAA